MEQPSFLHKSGRAIMKTATSTKPGTRCLCLGAPRDRACPRRERWDRRSFRAERARGNRVSTFLCSLRPGPAPLDVFGGALRGTVPALAGNVGTGGAFALPREGNYRESTFLRSLRPGPAPLDVFGGALRGLGVGPAYVSYAGPTPTVDPGVDSAVAPSCQPRALRGRG